MAKKRKPGLKIPSFSPGRFLPDQYAAAGTGHPIPVIFLALQRTR
jgi:hypothetical protein